MNEKKQKLEEGMIEDDDFDGVVGTVAVEPDDEDDMFGDGKDLDKSFDEEGNFIGDIEETLEPEEEPFKDDMTPDEPVPAKTEQPKANKQLSPEAIKIINLKKELAESQRAQRELLDGQKKQQQEKDIAARQAKLEEQGYDPDTAKNMSVTEIRIAQLEERTAKFDFMEENAEVFAKFPQAKANVLTIMNNTKLTGMTAEQVCKGLYGTADVPAYEKRAMDSIKGNIPSTQSKPNLNNARTATATDGLSAKELAEKAFLERTFKEKLTVEEYLKYRK